MKSQSGIDKFRKILIKITVTLTAKRTQSYSDSKMIQISIFYCFHSKFHPRNTGDIALFYF